MDYMKYQEILKWKSGCLFQEATAGSWLDLIAGQRYKNAHKLVQCLQNEAFDTVIPIPWPKTLLKYLGGSWREESTREDLEL